MTCDSARSFLDAYVDRELDLAAAFSMEEHLNTCEACSQRRQRLEALRSAIQAEAPRYHAPDALRKRILADLRATPGVYRQTRRRPFDWRWIAIAASVLVCAIVIGRMRMYPRHDQENPIAKEIIASHVRSLMANHLVDEPSSNQHTVKPWFAGKLDFSPVVRNLDAQGFPLAGGRLDYVGSRAVAAVVYRRRQHAINLFIWPSAQSGGETPRSFTVNGFNTIEWRRDGMQYWAVSDLNAQELQLFSRFIEPAAFP